MSQQTKISYHVRQLPQKAADILDNLKEFILEECKT